MPYNGSNFFKIGTNSKTQKLSKENANKNGTRLGGARAPQNPPRAHAPEKRKASFPTAHVCADARDGPFPHPIQAKNQTTPQIFTCSPRHFRSFSGSPRSKPNQKAERTIKDAHGYGDVSKLLRKKNQKIRTIKDAIVR